MFKTRRQEKEFQNITAIYNCINENSRVEKYNNGN